jgi:hypothetical protein
MKWFKHSTSAINDAKIEKLIMNYGIEGYGLYFACLEMIAGNISPEKVTFELEHDAEILAYKFKIDSVKVVKILRYFVDTGLFEYNESTKRITCYKLAKGLDNTTSQNPEIKAILNNLKLIKVNEIPLKQNRLDKNRLEKKREDKSINKPKIIKNKYGESGNVLLSDKEINTLKTKYSDGEVLAMIDKLSYYKLSSGKNYKSDYGAINQWVAAEIIKGKNKQSFSRETQHKKNIRESLEWAREMDAKGEK